MPIYEKLKRVYGKAKTKNKENSLMITAIGLAPQVEKEFLTSTVPSGLRAVMRARNKLWEMSQCRKPEEA